MMRWQSSMWHFGTQLFDLIRLKTGVYLPVPWFQYCLKDACVTFEIPSTYRPAGQSCSIEGLDYILRSHTAMFFLSVTRNSMG